MDKEMIINSLIAKYGRYGVAKEDLIRAIDDGIQNYDLSLEAIYSGLRMSLATTFGEREYFSVDDVMEVTGETRAEVLQRIEQYKQGLIEAGEDPDEYFQPIEPQERTLYYFPHGLN